MSVYKYQIGEIVNNSLKIIDQIRIPNGRKYTQKGYEVCSVLYPEAPTYTLSETSIKKGIGDAYKSNRKIFEGNSLYSLKWIRPYLTNIEEAKKIAPKSSQKVLFKCPDCNYYKRLRTDSMINQGFSCPNCSKGTSYPELFMLSYLKVKGIKYEYQKIFKDLSNRRFDFYLPEYNMVIETHGKQHYKRGIGYMDTDSIINSDKEKLKFCNKHKINYVTIDCSYSTFSYIKNNIDKNTHLPSIIENEVEDILELISLNKRYPVKKIIDLYLQGYTNREIGDVTGVSHHTVGRILLKNNIKKVYNRNYPIESIIGMYRDGYGTRYIGRIYNISYVTVINILKDNNEFYKK
ncbi:hypothetical protein [Staphylococcus phage vB_SurM-PSU4]|nr:hypothetical protein [Staphylococcus phage vB_SurM-PSU4]